MRLDIAGYILVLLKFTDYKYRVKATSTEWHSITSMKMAAVISSKKPTHYCTEKLHACQDFYSFRNQYEMWQ
jgi:hypothetical protein